MRSMHSRRGYSSFPTTFFIFSMLLLVLAGGFAVGRLVIGRAYVKSAGQFEKWPGPKAEPAPGAQSESEVPSGQGYVPEPAEQTPEPEAAPKPEAPAPPEKPADNRPEPPSTSSPEPETAPPPSEPPKQAPEGEKRYAIQVGVFAAEGGAQQVAEELARAGYPAKVEVARVETGTVYRVVTGRYRTEYAARKAMDQLKQEGFPGLLVER